MSVPMSCLSMDDTAQFYINNLHISELLTRTVSVSTDFDTLFFRYSTKFHTINTLIILNRPIKLFRSQFVDMFVMCVAIASLPRFQRFINYQYKSDSSG